MARLLNRCGFVAASSGSGDYVVSTAALGCRTPAAAGAIDGGCYTYYAQSADLTQYEWGIGIYAASTTKLARTKILGSTSGGAAVSFTQAPTVKLDALAENIVTGGPQQGRLVYGSGNNTVLFVPFGGDLVQIAGVLYRIPSAGVPGTTFSASYSFLNGVNNSNLVLETLYYVYVFNNGGTLALDFCSTGHATDTTEGNVGVEIKSGDNSRTLVGMVYTGIHAVAEFEDTPATRNVASWFNRRPRQIAGTATSGATTSSTSSWAELNFNDRAYFVCWGDSDPLSFIGGSASNSTSANQTVYAAVGIDGTTTLGAEGSITPPAANAGWGIPNVAGVSLAEGAHYFTPLGLVTGGTGSYYVSAGGMIFI